MPDDDIAFGTAVVLYLRKSKETQINSIVDQDGVVGKIVEERKLVVLKTYADAGISGATVEERDDFKQMLVEAPRIGAKAVLFYNTSRLTRGGVKAMWKIVDALEAQGVKVYNCQQRKFVDENDMGSAITTSVEAAQAKASNIDHALDISRTMVANVRDRKNAPGARPPYGFDRLYIDESGKPFQQVRWETDGSKSILDPVTLEPKTTLSPKTPYLKIKAHKVVLVPSSIPERVETAKLMQRLAKSMGYTAIAGHLNEKGIPSPGGDLWSSTTIRSLLLNPAFGGDIVYNRTTKSRYAHLEDGQVVKRTEKVGEVQFKYNPKDKWIVVPGGHEALVSKDEREAVETAMAIRSRSSIKTSRSPNRVYPLSGIMVCGNCGDPMQGMCPDEKYRRYICGKRRKNGKNACVPCSVTAAKVEGFVIGTIREYMASDCAKDHLKQGLEEIFDAQIRTVNDLDAARRDVEDFEKEKKGLFAQIRAAGAAQLFAAQIQEMQEEEARRKRRLAAAEAAAGDTRDKAGFIRQGLDLYENRVLQLQGGCENAIRECLRALGTKVIYHPEKKEGGIEIHPFGHSAAS